MTGAAGCAFVRRCVWIITGYEKGTFTLCKEMEREHQRDVTVGM